VLYDQDGIGGGSPGEGPALKGVDEGVNHCLGREGRSYHARKDFREYLKEDDNPEGGR